MLLSGAAVGPEGPFPFGPMLLGVVFCFISLAAIRMHGRDLLRWRVEHRVRRGACGDCGYDLLGLGPENTPGPARCPECGCHWPLVVLPPSPRT